MTCWQQVQATADEHCLEAPWRPRCWLLEKTRTRCSLGAGSKADYTEAGAEGILIELSVLRLTCDKELVPTATR